MIGKKVEKAFNDQINAELYSAYLYLSMAAWFESQNLPGCANWMRVQCLEEMTHAQKFFNQIIERSGRVLLKPIAGPETEWKSPLDAFAAALKHERKVTALIAKLVEIGAAEGDHAAGVFLQWFVTEQVEEEKNAETISALLQQAGDSKGALFMLDRELGGRKFQGADGGD